MDEVDLLTACEFCWNKMDGIESAVCPECGFCNDCFEHDADGHKWWCGYKKEED